MSNIKKVDPISLLRDSFLEKKAIKNDKNLLIFNDKTTLRLDTMTAWQPPDKTKRYSVGDLWLFLSVKAEKRPTAEYYQKISAFKQCYQAQMISFQHQGELTRRNRKILLWVHRNFRLH